MPTGWKPECGSESRKKQHCRLVSLSDMFVQQERTKVQLTWDLSVKPLSENSCCDYCGRERAGCRQRYRLPLCTEIGSTKRPSRRAFSRHRLVLELRHCAGLSGLISSRRGIP